MLKKNKSKKQNRKKKTAATVENLRVLEFLLIKKIKLCRFSLQLLTQITVNCNQYY